MLYLNGRISVICSLNAFYIEEKINITCVKYYMLQHGISLTHDQELPNDSYIMDYFGFRVAPMFIKKMMHIKVHSMGFLLKYHSFCSEPTQPDHNKMILNRGGGLRGVWVSCEDG